MKKYTLNRPHSLFRFCGNTDIVLFLLQKELKGVKVSHLCTPLGISSDFFYPNLGTLILSLMDLPYRSESFMAWYEKKLQKWSAKVDLENNSATAELTLDFYHYLKKKFKNVSKD
mgnify:CR=1 FL=1|jgi:hypothetical protein